MTESGNLSYSKLPVWQGVRDSYGDLKYLPFSLYLNPNGFISQKPDPEIFAAIERLYKDEQYTHPTTPPGESEWSVSRSQNYLNLIQSLVAQVKISWNSVLDIGAGSYFFPLGMMKHFNISKYTIVDPSLNCSTKPENISLFSTFFNADTLPKNTKFDTIVSLNCFEHLPNPGDFLDNCRGHLNKNGKVILVFPDTEDQLKFGDLNALWHEHINYFSEASARHLFECHKFKVLEFKRQLGDLTFLLEPTDQAGPADPNYSSNLISFFNMSTASFQKNSHTIVRQLIMMLKKKKIVGFHGACSGLNLLLSLLKEESPDCYASQIHIFDGDLSKTGKYLPAFDAPILHSKNERYKECDLILVPTLPFFNEIRDFAVSFHKINECEIIYLYDLERIIQHE